MFGIVFRSFTCAGAVGASAKSWLHMVSKKRSTNVARKHVFSKIPCLLRLGMYFCVYVSKFYSITRASAGNASVNSCCHMVSCQTKVQEHERKHGIHALLALLQTVWFLLWFLTETLHVVLQCMPLDTVLT